MSVRLVTDDVEELRAQIAETEQYALAHAEELAQLLMDGLNPVRAAALAVTVREQTRLARRLRHALALQVAG